MTTGRRIAGTLILGAAFLLCEIRFEHREVLRGTARSWIPLGYCALLLAAGIPAWLAWDRGGRKLLVALFSAGLVVGLLGAWFHSDGRPGKTFLRVAKAWVLPPGQDGGVKAGSIPPLLAPLAFCGLGMLGLLSCAYDDRRLPTGEYRGHNAGQEARETT